MCPYFNILKLVSSLFLVFMTVFCHAQGSWDIGYIKMQSLNKSHIGKIVRIDFKSSNVSKSPNKQRYIRSYIGTKDTATVRIDTTFFILAEQREIYVDHGSYDDQYLKCINCKKEELFIYDAKIIDLDDVSIKFQVDVEVKITDQPIKKVKKSIRINRNKLDGIMYRRS